MKSVQSACVLNQRALPRDRHREEERVQAGIVKSLPDIAAGSQDKPFLRVDLALSLYWDRGGARIVLETRSARQAQSGSHSTIARTVTRRSRPSGKQALTTPAKTRRLGEPSVPGLLCSSAYSRYCASKFARVGTSFVDCSFPKVPSWRDWRTCRLCCSAPRRVFIGGKSRTRLMPEHKFTATMNGIRPSAAMNRDGRSSAHTHAYLRDTEVAIFAMYFINEGTC